MLQPRFNHLETAETLLCLFGDSRRCHIVVLRRSAQKLVPDAASHDIRLVSVFFKDINNSFYIFRHTDNHLKVPPYVRTVKIFNRRPAPK